MTINNRLFGLALLLAAFVGAVLGARMAFYQYGITAHTMVMAAFLVLGVVSILLGLLHRREGDRLLAPLGVVWLVYSLSYFLGNRLPDGFRLWMPLVGFVVAVPWYLHIRKQIRTRPTAV